MTLEEQIAAVTAAGFRVNNLFQLAAGWRANLTDGVNFHDYGAGATPAAALADAMKKAKIEVVNLWD